MVNGSPRSPLLLALDQDSRVVGFAATEPLFAANGGTAELRYLGVRPEVWGGGVAAQLMGTLRDSLREVGFRRAQLAVYVDNVRAAALYERLGWSRQGCAVPHPRSGRLEQRYQLGL